MTKVSVVTTYVSLTAVLLLFLIGLSSLRPTVADEPYTQACSTVNCGNPATVENLQNTKNDLQPQ